MNRNLALDVSDYNYFVEMDFNLDENKEYTVDGLKINYLSDTSILSFQKDEVNVAEIDLIEMIKSFHENQNNNQLESLEEATIEYSFDDISMKIIIGDIYYQETSDTNEKPYSNIYFKTLIK